MNGQNIIKEMGKLKMKVKAIKILWKAPEEGWVKYNTDGAVRREDEGSSYVFYLRDENEDVLFAKGEPHYYANSMQAEAYTIFYAAKHDEVSAIVIDLGSHTCKAGYAGEDAPKAVFPSAVGSVDQMEDDNPDNPEDNSGSALDSKSKVKRKLYVGSQALGFRRDFMEVISPIKDGVVVDWDIVENIWDHAFRECLLINPKEHPMLLAEPCSNTQQQREKAAEMMFEKYQVPALFLAKNAVLTSFASGRATSLVVDSGGGLATVAPVHDGYVLQKAVATSPIGGEILTDCLIKSLEQKGIMIKPRYSFKRKEIRPGEFQTVDVDFPDTTESYKLYCQRAIASDIKECVSRVPDTPYDGFFFSQLLYPYTLLNSLIL
ncbi:Actin-related protein 4 [Capsicum baccatum]|uniref:Actin-related protein 4 n=1 Tax=Capsicum baccatum TaxID=33114 RepID=A0A2G2X698_CAPBA|nr:Actin-related protein 4 [Capsicum baccatum]